MDLVGFEQSFSSAEQIDNDLTISKSGLYFQNQHPFLTIPNIKAIMPPNVELSEYLKREVRSGISAVVQKFITKKILSEQTRNIIDNVALLSGVGQTKNIILNESKLVGYEILPIRGIGITTRINRIGLQMHGGGGGQIKMYLFHSSKIEPIKTYAFDIKGSKGFEWFDVYDLFMPYFGQNTNIGGRWFLVYNQKSLPNEMDAVNINHDFSNVQNCRGCNWASFDTWSKMGQFLTIKPFKVFAPSDFSINPQMWEIDRQIYTSQTNYGINFEFTIGCDLTDFIIRQRHIFANVLAKQVAYNILRKMTMNPEANVNRKQVNVSRESILYELDGDPQGRKSGLGLEIENAFDALSIDTSGLDSFCLKCDGQRIIHRTIG